MAAPIDFSVADETERDLSPLYVDSDEPWRWGSTAATVAGPVLRHHELPWIGVQRSPHLVEVIDIATGAVLHRVSTG